MSAHRQATFDDEFHGACDTSRAPDRQFALLRRAALLGAAVALCGGGALGTGSPAPLTTTLALVLGLATGVLLGAALLHAKPGWARAWLWSNAAGWGPGLAVAFVVGPAALDLGPTTALAISATGVGLLGGTVLAIAAGGPAREAHAEDA